MKKFIGQDKGFTLIEILIAIALLAVIAAIVVPNTTGFLGRGQSEAYKAEKKTIQAAVDAYYTDPGNRVSGARQYPTGTGTGSDSPGAGSMAGTTVWTANAYLSFAKLMSDGSGDSYLNDFPESASAVGNGSTAFTGSYWWYVDSKGRVLSSPAYSGTFP